MELRLFKISYFAPPGGKWFYKTPETDFYKETRESLGRLEYVVRDHYRANKLTIPSNLSALIQDYMCQRLPDGFCTGGPPPGGRKKYLSFFDVLSATESMLRGFSSSDGKFELITEALERAFVCRQCRSNALHMCSNCNGLRKTASSLVGGRKTKIDSYLGVCEYSGIVISGQVYLSKEYLQDRVVKKVLAAGEELPESCWMMS